MRWSLLIWMLVLLGACSSTDLVFEPDDGGASGPENGAGNDDGLEGTGSAVEGSGAGGTDGVLGGASGNGGTVCSPGQFSCTDGLLKQCNDAGDGFARQEPCAGDRCDPASGQCRPCVPGERTCSGNTALICNARGDGYDEEPCLGETPLCEPKSGRCVQCLNVNGSGECGLECEPGSPECPGSDACVPEEDGCCSAEDCTEALASQTAACETGTCRYTFADGWTTGGRDEYGEWAGFELGGQGFRMRYIAPGTFVMGSPVGEVPRYPQEVQHEVELTRGYWLGETEVTQAQWQAVMVANPSRFVGAERPVERVSWVDAQDFLSALNGQVAAGRLRLPTEAEWEYACRAGTTTARYGELDDIAWYAGNSESETHPVAQKQRNAWGLHDMLGNVWEWCSDRYGDYPTSRVVDPTGPETGTERVLRGGGWVDVAGDVRAALRVSHEPEPESGGGDARGFRLARGQLR